MTEPAIALTIIDTELSATAFSPYSKDLAIPNAWEAEPSPIPYAFLLFTLARFKIMGPNNIPENPAIITNNEVKDEFPPT